MITRVTHQTIQRSSLANLQMNLSAMARLQEQMSSTKLINRPSDDPAGTADALSIRASLRATYQYGRNAQDGAGWLSTIDSALESSLTIMHRVRALTVQAASTGSGSPESREAIAIELEGLSESLLQVANTTYVGRTVFAGTSNAGVAFQSDGTYTGTAGSSVERRIADATTIRVDADGSAVFGSGATSAFAFINDLAAEIRAGGVGFTHRIDDVDARLNTILATAADVGARYGRIMDAQQTTLGRELDLEGQLSSIVDIDLPKTIMELEMRNLTYQTALGATARALQPSLMDFLR